MIVALDVAVANRDSNTVSVFRGNNDGTLQPSIDYATGPAPISVLVEDMNGDGNPDLIVPNADIGASSVSVLLGNGNGTFRARIGYHVTSPPLSATVADLDGDGKLDVVAGVAGPAISVLLGIGDGTFQAMVNYSVTNSDSNSVAVAVADITGDGKLDVLSLNSIFEGGGSITMLPGNGDGTFRAGTELDTGPDPTGLVATDVSGDGKADLIVSEQAGILSVLIGNGDGTFQPRVSYGMASNLSPPVLVDINSDGYLDIVAASASSDTIGVLIGKGDGTFATSVFYAAEAFPKFVGAGDLSGDGRPDLVVAGNNTVSILIDRCLP